MSRIMMSLRSALRQNIRAFTTSRILAVQVDSSFISQITAAEKALTNSQEPLQRGPTAAAQSHVGADLTAKVIRDITLGERLITGKDGPVPGGPTSIAQSILSAGRAPHRTNSATAASASSSSASSEQHSGRLDTETMSKITEKEKELTGKDMPVKGGPTAKAQQHAGEDITSEVLSEITKGEKSITGGERVKGGPTSAAQSELGKSRS